jgi:sulfate adenylyltransferase large subunit
MDDTPAVAALSDKLSLASVEAPTLLRFITCGSVDDGKSTLIGRLLHDTGNIPDDQLTRLSAESRRWGTQGDHVDYALLLDGLSAEREQGITIDVAYRYFGTPRRAFIVADTPGHRQYTRNMATGASTADLAVLLVDAQKGIITQTRRHALIASMLGVRHLVLAVNKMDRADYREALFTEVAGDFIAFAARLGFASIVSIPVAAKLGENVVHPADTMPWYEGPTLLEHLERVDVRETLEALPFRMPVQLVSRPTPDFRGYAGTIAAGVLRTGTRVSILPGDSTAGIARIVTADGDLAVAVAGQAVTVVFDEDIDVSRGDMLADAGQPATVTDTLETSLLWVSDTPLDPARAYLLKAGAATVAARVASPNQGIDVETGALVVMTSLSMNEVGRVAVRLDRKLAFDTYRRSRGTGGFILIDRLTNDTSAIGLVEEALALVDTPKVAAGRWPILTGETAWRSLTKAFCWRAVGSLGTIVLAFALTHNRGLAALIGSGEVLTKIIIYFLHERVWARIPFGVTRST